MALWILSRKGEVQFMLFRKELNALEKAPTSTLYAIAEIKRSFLDSTEISASEEPNALEKPPVQFMSLWKLSGKCHFLLRFCMSN